MSSQKVQNRQNTDQLETVPLTKLLAGRKYTWISHAGETYLLQLTKANKLLLTK